MRAVLAVHEAGHGLIYALLFKQPPLEVRINRATFSGGYNSLKALKIKTRVNLLDAMCVAFAGRAADEMASNGISGRTHANVHRLQPAVNRHSTVSIAQATGISDDQSPQDALEPFDAKLREFERRSA